MLRKKFSLFYNRAFTVYFIGACVSMIGTGIKFIAITWLALQLTNTPSSVAFVLLSEAIPGTLFSPIFGVYIDKMDRKALVTVVNCCQALALFTIPVAAWLGSLTIWQLYIVIFLVATGDVLYRATTMVLVREIVPKNILLHANTTSAISDQIGVAVGAIVAGLIIAYYSAIAAIAVYGILLLIGALWFWSIRRYHIHQAKPIDKSKTGWKRFVDDIREGITYISHHSDIIPMYIMMLVLVATLRTINILLPTFAQDVLKVGGQGFGYIDSSFGIGAIIGNLLLPRLRQHLSVKWTMYVGLISLVCSLTFFALSSNLWMAITGYLLIGVTYQVRVFFLTQAQESVELGYQGRIHATLNLFFYFASILVYIVMGALSSLVSQRWLYILQACIVACTGIFVFWRSWKGSTSSAS